MVAVIAMVCLVVTEFAVERINHDDGFYQENGWPKLLGMTLAAMLVWAFSIFIDRQHVDADSESGEQSPFSATTNHSMFFIPIKYWSPLLIVIGIALLFAK